MDLPDLIALLSRPEAYPHPVTAIDVRQTHISVVFLAGEFAYKVKKPVDLGFLDFTTLEKRRHFCDEETRLNRRLAPGVYLGVVPVTRDGVEGSGEVVEWAVKMARLPDEASLRWHVRHGKVTHDQLDALAGRIAEFHRSAESGERIAAFGRFEVVAGNARENFAQSRGQIGATVSQPVFDRLEALTEEALTRLRPLIESRAARGMPRDTHGDLRLDHVYVLDGWPIIDCVEFNERFRYADPVADAAFLVMDLLFEGHENLAEYFASQYVGWPRDESWDLLPFYVAYRAAVRGKVEGMKSSEPEVCQGDRDAARFAARAYWLLALGQLEEPVRRPCLVLIGGLPGTGKSTLARETAEAHGFEVIRSDVVRKELAGDTAGSGEGIYSAEWTERTYVECLRRALGLLFEGKRVIVDATFRSDWSRNLFLSAAPAAGVPGLLLVCETPPGVVKQRLAARRGDVSDADWAVYEQMAATWEPVRGWYKKVTYFIDTTGPVRRSITEGILARNRLA